MSKRTYIQPSVERIGVDRYLMNLCDSLAVASGQRNGISANADDDSQWGQVLGRETFFGDGDGSEPSTSNYHKSLWDD